MSVCVVFLLALEVLFNLSRIRRKTWARLQMYENGVLVDVLQGVMSFEPIFPVISKLHVSAIDRRLGVVIETVEQCIARYNQQYVIIPDRQQNAQLLRLSNAHFIPAVEMSHMQCSLYIGSCLSYHFISCELRKSYKLNLWQALYLQCFWNKFQICLYEMQAM